MAVFRTGNPALSEKTRSGTLAAHGRRGHDPAGHRQQDGPLPAHRPAPAPPSPGTWPARPAGARWALIGGADPGPRHHLQEDVGAHHDAALRRSSRACSWAAISRMYDAAVSRASCRSRWASRWARWRALLLAYTLAAHQVTRELPAGHRSPPPAPSPSSTSSRWCWASSASASRSSTRRGIVGIGFSVVVVVIAALNLVLDFDFIERGAADGRAEVHGVVRRPSACWSRSIWLYLEILRLLAKIMGKDRR